MAVISNCIHVVTSTFSQMNSVSFYDFRALAIKRKAEAEREEKRRQQILAKRREKQQEATEKFQRAHISSRPGSGSSNGCM